MKQLTSYSHAHGAMFILSLLCAIVYFFDSAWFYTNYSAYAQPHTTAVNKTHLVIGGGKQKSGEQSIFGASPTHSHCNVLFSPDDDIARELLTLIEQEKKSIRVAIFTFTDTEIAQALIDAASRGVNVQVVADTSYLRDQYSKIPLLQQHKVPVFTYNPHYKNGKQKKKEHLSIMHHKFMVFEQNKGNQPVVVSGSYNLTRAARFRNQEHVIISDDKQVITRFKHQFERLKKRCDNCFEELPQGRTATA